MATPKTTSEWISEDASVVTQMRHHAQFIQDRAILLHAHAEQYPDLKHRYGTDATKMYTMVALNYINEQMAQVIAQIDYLEGLHKEFQEPE